MQCFSLQEKLTGRLRVFLAVHLTDSLGGALTGHELVDANLW